MKLQSAPGRKRKVWQVLCCYSIKDGDELELFCVMESGCRIAMKTSMLIFSCGQWSSVIHGSSMSTDYASCKNK